MQSLVLWNMLGASAAQIGQLEQAILAFNKALSIKPVMRGYNNMGNFSKSKISWKKQ